MRMVATAHVNSLNRLTAAAFCNVLMRFTADLEIPFQQDGTISRLRMKIRFKALRAAPRARLNGHQQLRESLDSNPFIRRQGTIFQC